MYLRDPYCSSQRLCQLTPGNKQIKLRVEVGPQNAYLRKKLASSSEDGGVYFNIKDQDYISSFRGDFNFMVESEMKTSSQSGEKKVNATSVTGYKNENPKVIIELFEQGNKQKNI